MCSTYFSLAENFNSHQTCPAAQRCDTDVKKGNIKCRFIELAQVREIYDEHLHVATNLALMFQGQNLFLKGCSDTNNQDSPDDVKHQLKDSISFPIMDSVTGNLKIILL